MYVQDNIVMSIPYSLYLADYVLQICNFLDQILVIALLSIEQEILKFGGGTTF